MGKRNSETGAATFLGIECGGTRSVALLADARDNELNRATFGPANLRLLNDAQLARHLRSIAKEFPKPDAVCIGMAGARTEADWRRLQAAAAAAWKNIPCRATNDLETALAADRSRGGKSAPGAQILVLSGTGSCCYGRNAEGVTRKIGGWGHILGDKGSGYEIGLRGLKAVVYYLDLDGRWTALGQRLLRALNLNEPNQLIGWVLEASKDEVAALATEVFAAAAKGDQIAKDILSGAASSLAKDAVNCAEGLASQGERVRFVFNGGVLLKQPGFARKVAARIRERWPAAECGALKRESVWGAVTLARGGASKAGAESSVVSPASPAFARAESGGVGPQGPAPWDIRHLPAATTEQRHPESMNLDRMPVGSAIDLMLAGDEAIPLAIRRERRKIEWVVRKVAAAFEAGGRLFYVGAGTSGRLGILDASECPPTFRADPEMVQGIIAGGARAIANPVEGAEDDPEAGARAIRFRGVSRKDVVVGIAASGRTPFVWGALWEARKAGAATALVCFNPNLKVAQADRPDRIIAPDIGPELLTGSTRLKSGTATKLILNIVTTLAMVRIGKVVSNLMVDVNPTNVKLRDRAVRIVREIAGCDDAAARCALDKAGWKVKDACELAGIRR